MDSTLWLVPLLRGLLGVLTLGVLVLGAWWQFGRRGRADEPFDPGLD